MGGGWSTTRTGSFSPEKRPGTHFTGDWVIHRASLNGWGKSRYHRDFLFTFLFVLLFLPSVLPFLSILHLYTLMSSCHLFLYNTNIHAPGGIRTRNPSRQSAADPRPRPLGHWDRRIRSPDRPAIPTELTRPTCLGLQNIKPADAD